MHEHEQIHAIYFDADALRLPPVKLYRHDDGHDRFYYTYDLKDQLTIFPGVTAMLSAVLPTPQGLIDWKLSKGATEADRYTTERMFYGTLMHTEAAKLLIAKRYDQADIAGIVRDYFAENGLSYSPGAWEYELKKDLLALAAWVKEYEVKPLAVELPLYSSTYGVASCVDLVCELSIEEKGFWGETYKSGPQKGQPKETKQRNRRFAIVDFKSGKRSYSSVNNELQLLFYQEIVKANFPEFANTDFLLFNWHPKDWQSEPGCHLMEQTEKHSLRELEIYAELYHLQHDLGKNTKLFMSGVIDLSGDLSENYQRKTWEEVLAS